MTREAFVETFDQRERLWILAAAASRLGQPQKLYRLIRGEVRVAFEHGTIKVERLVAIPLLQEQTAVHGRLVSYQDIIGLFLHHLAAQARAAAERSLPSTMGARSRLKYCSESDWLRGSKK